MEQETSFVVVDGVVVPESALRRAERCNLYGSVPGLDDEELATPEELERQVMLDEWGPVLALPVRGSKGFRPDFADNGGVEFDAFATVDFQRTMPEFDKARYKAEKLKEGLQNVFILFGMVKARLPDAARDVLKYLEAGGIELEHMATEDMLALARLYLRARRFQREMRDLHQASWSRMRKELAEVLR